MLLRPTRRAMGRCRSMLSSLRGCASLCHTSKALPEPCWAKCSQAPEGCHRYLEQVHWNDPGKPENCMGLNIMWCSPRTAHQPMKVLPVLSHVWIEAQFNKGQPLSEEVQMVHATSTAIRSAMLRM